MKKLPIGIQSFEKLRSEGYLYVDKTKEIHQLTSSNIVFLSRPRRFGKSLLISTLGELYKGNQSLFEGLYIYDKWDWTQQYPVIRIDWTSIKHRSKEEMEEDMITFLKRQANLYEISLVSKYASSIFSELIELLHRKTGKKAVVLIDEYDKPILDSMGIPLLFQTGYLTVKEEKMTDGDSQYTLGVPNLEVRESLMKHLLNAFTQYPVEQLGTLGKKMLQQILNFDAEGFANNMRKMLADVPYTLKASKSRNKARAEAENIENEARYHIICQVWMTLLGFNIQSEKPTNRGRIDAVLQQPGLAIVAELKYHATTKIDTLLDQAIAQIREKRYYEPFLDRKVILLGIAFSGKEVGCRIEQLTFEN